MKAVPAKPESRQPDFRAFEQLEAMAQSLASDYVMVQRAWKDLRAFQKNGLRGHLPTSVGEVIERVSLAGSLRARVQRIEVMVAALELDEAFDETSLTRAEVTKWIGLLLGSFPTSNVPDPQIYTRLLVEDVMASRTSVLPLEAACRKIRRTQKFVPSISEVLAVLQDQIKLWDVRYQAIDCIEGYVAELKEAQASVEQARSTQHRLITQVLEAGFGAACGVKAKVPAGEAET